MSPRGESTALITTSPTYPAVTPTYRPDGPRAAASAAAFSSTASIPFCTRFSSIWRTWSASSMSGAGPDAISPRTRTTAGSSFMFIASTSSLHQAAEVGGGLHHARLPGKIQEAAHDGAAPVGLGHDHLDVFRLGVSLPVRLQEHVRVQEDRGQGIVDLVRHARGDLAHGGKPLRLHELVLRSSERGSPPAPPPGRAGTCSPRQTPGTRQSPCRGRSGSRRTRSSAGPRARTSAFSAAQPRISASEGCGRTTASLAELAREVDAVELAERLLHVLAGHGPVQLVDVVGEHLLAREHAHRVGHLRAVDAAFAEQHVQDPGLARCPPPAPGTPAAHGPCPR